MVIVSLLTAGVNLAVQKYAERQAASSSAHNQDNENQLTHQETGIISPPLNQKDAEEEALKELQGYANFQERLSGRVLGQLQEDQSSYYQGSLNISQRPLSNEYLDPPKYASSQPQPIHGRLRGPIILPRQQGDGRNGWTRVFVPDLMGAGMDQKVLGDFLDGFENYVSSLSYVEAINVAFLKSTLYGDEDFPSYVEDLTLATAAAMVKTRNLEYKSCSLLDEANEKLFSPCGVFAMIVISQPGDPTLVVSVNLEDATHLRDQHMGMGMMGAVNTGSSNQYGQEQSSNSRHNTGMGKMGDMISDFTKHRQRRRGMRKISSLRSMYDGARSGVSDVSRSRGRFGKSVEKGHGLGREHGLSSTMGSAPKGPVAIAKSVLSPGGLYLVIVNDPDPQHSLEPPVGQYSSGMQLNIPTMFGGAMF